MSFPHSRMCFFRTAQCVVSEQDIVTSPKRPRRNASAEAVPLKPPRRNVHDESSPPRRRNECDEAKTTPNFFAILNSDGHMAASHLFASITFRKGVAPHQNFSMNPCVRRRTIPCVRRKTILASEERQFLVFDERHSLCSKKDIPCV